MFFLVIGVCVILWGAFTTIQIGNLKILKDAQLGKCPELHPKYYTNIKKVISHTHIYFYYKCWSSRAPRRKSGFVTKSLNMTRSREWHLVCLAATSFRKKKKKNLSILGNQQLISHSAGFDWERKKNTLDPEVILKIVPSLVLNLIRSEWIGRNQKRTRRAAYW